MKSFYALTLLLFSTVLISQSNPMGKTWVVFIENSQYIFFPSIASPTEDVVQIKKAFDGYKVDRIVHKQNMSQSNLQNFFSNELMNMVTENKVNSVLIWYAGHGKVINDASYWIPVDAKRDNENTFYDITNLKSSLSTFSNQLTHILIITDACESGPSFYHAMRSMNTQQSCDDANAVQSRSSQILTSSGNRYGFEESVFTKTFVNTLNQSPRSCIPIDYIAVEIAKVAVQNNQNKPKFGKISNLDDDNGTFFFIKR